jgi:hypothetical protein
MMMKKSVSNLIKRHVTDSLPIHLAGGDIWKKGVKNLKREYLSLPHNRRAAFKVRLA